MCVFGLQAVTTQMILHIISIRFLGNLLIIKVFHNLSYFPGTSYSNGIFVVKLSIIPVHFSQAQYFPAYSPI